MPAWLLIPCGIAPEALLVGAAMFWAFKPRTCSKKTFLHRARVPWFIERAGHIIWSPVDGLRAGFYDGEFGRAR